MTKDEEILELKAALRESRDKFEKKINLDLIKALKLETDGNYLLFFGKNSGLYLDDIARIKIPQLDHAIFVLNDPDRVKLIKALDKTMKEHAWDENVKKTFLRSFTHYLNKEL